MDKIYIFGHRKPDTDSVCGALALSHLKNKMGLNTEPRILSEVNLETSYVLKRFKFNTPKYLNDVKIQLKDVKYKKGYYINQNESIYYTFDYMNKKNITGVPIVDDNKQFVGYVSLKEIANELIVSSSNYLCTSFENIAKTLNATKTYKYDEQIEGNVMAVSLPYRLFIEDVPLDEKSIIIVGNREHIIEHAIKSKIKLLIIINNYNLTEEQKNMAKINNINIIITPNDTFKTARIITLSNPINSIKRGTNTICFDPNDYLSDFLQISNSLKHTNYPIVNGKGYCDGMLRVIDTGELTRKKVILVDHNDPEQSAEGLNEAEILEIVDHHNIGDISTHTPINFRNMSVGSVNTIVYNLYLEHGVDIPTNIAGIMLSGIISDTLLLKSPTTTMIDKEVALILAKKAKVDIKKYGMELLESGVSIKGLTKEQVIFRDFKNYTAGNHKFAVAQVFAITFKEYIDNISEYIVAINEIAVNNGYKIVCLFVTDIIENNSYLLYNTKAEKYLSDAFNVIDLKQGYLLNGVVSRKKQMVPPIMDVLDKN